MKFKTLVADNLPLEVKYEIIASRAPVSYLLASAKRIEKLPNINPEKTIIENIIDYYSDTYNDISPLLELLGEKIFDRELLIMFRLHGEYVFPFYVRQLGVNADYEELSDYISAQKNTHEYKTYHLVEKFKKIFLEDNLSDIRAIELVIESFYQTLQVDPHLAVRDLKSLIDIKLNCPDSCLCYDDYHVDDKFSTCYKNADLDDLFYEITISNKHSIGSFNHELTHCIHFYYKAMQTPEEFKKKITNVDSKTLDNMMLTIEETGKKLLPSNIDVLREFVKYIKYKKNSLKAYKKEIKNDFKKMFGTDDLLDEVLSINETDNELIGMLYFAVINKQKYNDTPKNQKKMELYLTKRLLLEFIEFRNMFYDLNNTEFYCFCDFIDSYTKGELWAKNKNNTNLPIQGHYKNYFVEDENNQFAEMLAEYVTLKKSPKGEEYINILKEIFSEELIEIMDKYYRNISKKHVLKKEK